MAGRKSLDLDQRRRIRRQSLQQRGPELTRQRPQTQHAISLRQGDEIDAGNDQAGHTPTFSSRASQADRAVGAVLQN